MNIRHLNRVAHGTADFTLFMFAFAVMRQHVARAVTVRCRTVRIFARREMRHQYFVLCTVLETAHPRLVRFAAFTLTRVSQAQDARPLPLPQSPPDALLRLPLRNNALHPPRERLGVAVNSERLRRAVQRILNQARDREYLFQELIRRCRAVLGSCARLHLQQLCHNRLERTLPDPPFVLWSVPRALALCDRRRHLCGVGSAGVRRGRGCVRRGRGAWAGRGWVCEVLLLVVVMSGLLPILEKSALPGKICDFFPATNFSSALPTFKLSPSHRFTKNELSEKKTSEGQKVAICTVKYLFEREF